jgi:hypothetical protein
LFAIRKELLKSALADDETRLKMNLAKDWHEIENILEEFAHKKGFRILEITPK